jgi:hypothetical protein
MLLTVLCHANHGLPHLHTSDWLGLALLAVSAALVLGVPALIKRRGR